MHYWLTSEQRNVQMMKLTYTVDAFTEEVIKIPKMKTTLQCIKCWFFVRKWNKENQTWKECRHKRKALQKEIMRHFPLAYWYNITKGQ